MSDAARPAAGAPGTLSVLIVNWNAAELLRECLRSLARQDLDPARVEVLVVDNASSDGSAEMIRAEFPGVRLLRNDRNAGFAAANNQGLALGRGKYFLLLNPDTVVPERTLLREWVEFMEAHPDVGASGVRLVFPDGRHQFGDTGFRPSVATLLGYASLLAKAMPRAVKGVYQDFSRMGRPRDVDWVCGAALLARADAVRAVGGLDEGIFMFAEDIEWCCRMRDAGFRVVYLPHLAIEHHQGGSVRKQGDQRTFSVMWLRNLRALYGRYNPRQPAFVFDGIMLVGFCARAALYAARYALTRDRWSLDRARAMVRYMRGIAGGLEAPR
jgi:N-acetylglucosaminyl-diphospho-decaprenol L-rhamnosyltransferase